MFLLCLWRVDEDIRHLNKIIISCQTPYLAYKEYPTKYGKLPWGHVLYDCPCHRDGSQGQPLKTLGLKIPRDWAVWTGAGPASTDLHFYSLQLFFLTCSKLQARRLQSLLENTQVALNHRNGAIETQNSPQLSISWPYKFNSNAFNIKNWFLQLLNNSHWFTIWFSLRSPNKFTQRRPGCSDWEMFHTFHHLLDEEGVGVASSL